MNFALRCLPTVLRIVFEIFLSRFSSCINLLILFSLTVEKSFKQLTWERWDHCLCCGAASLGERYLNPLVCFWSSVWYCDKWLTYKMFLSDVSIYNANVRKEHSRTGDDNGNTWYLWIQTATISILEASGSYCHNNCGVDHNSLIGLLLTHSWYVKVGFLVFRNATVNIQLKLCRGISC